MKRLWMLTVALLLVGSTWLYAEDRGDGGHRGGGHGSADSGGSQGMMGGERDGCGPGMMDSGEMGMASGGGMMWGEQNPAFAQLPEEKRTQLRALHDEVKSKMDAQLKTMKERGMDLQKAMSSFPIDRAGAIKAWEGMDAFRKQMLALKLDTAAKMQQILGKERWESLHSARAECGTPAGGPCTGRQ